MVYLFELSSRRKPEYIAVYVKPPVGDIRFFGKIDSITRELGNYVADDMSGNSAHRSQWVNITSNDLRSLANPITRGSNGRKIPKGIQFKRMSKFSKARTLDQL
jgi:hypothetical protein